MLIQRGLGLGLRVEGLNARLRAVGCRPFEHFHSRRLKSRLASVLFKQTLRKLS